MIHWPKTYMHHLAMKNFNFSLHKRAVNKFILPLKQNYIDVSQIFNTLGIKKVIIVS